MSGTTRLFISFVLGLVGAPAAFAQVDYSRAEQFLSSRLQELVLRGDIEPQWLPDGRFWYRTRTEHGWEFSLVDPDRNTHRGWIDTERLASAVSRVADGATYSQETLTFAFLKVQDDLRSIEFSESGLSFRCDVKDYRCVRMKRDLTWPVAMSLRSPDGQWNAYIEGYNVFIRNLHGGEIRQLTQDGTELQGYGLAPKFPGEERLGKRFLEPVLAWSPDSRKIAVLRWDWRGVRMMPIYSSTTVRPQLYLYPYGLPGDEAVERFDIHVVDVEAKRNVRLQAPPQPKVFWEGQWTTRSWNIVAREHSDKEWGGVKWSKDATQLYFHHVSRAAERIALLVADASTGRTRELISEARPETVPSLQMVPTGEPVWRSGSEQDLLWFSWRDGWGHLYRYGPDGVLRNQITSGPWSITKVEHVDHEQGVLYFTARGRDLQRFQYHSYAYRVNLDGSGLQLLTEEDADHQVSFSQDGRYFVDRYSRQDLPPVAVLRSARDGKVLRELERADISRLLATGWRAPELFEAVAADGVTPIYGWIYRPSHFDSAKCYPVIDNIYPAPSGPVSNWGFDTGSAYGERQALAELGFIVVALTGRGTPYRSMEFLETYRGQAGLNMLPDHVAAIEQLGARHRWIDLERVGIYGMSGGGYAAAAGMLRYPEFFKVAVSINGDHDLRTYSYGYGEKLDGPLVRDPVTGKDNYEAQANYTLASQLKGKLLLMASDMDDNVHPANTFRLVHALIAANKKFDLMLFPDRGHDLGLSQPYERHMIWDYFLAHLQEELTHTTAAVRGVDSIH